jgi:hypothetical protein
MLGGLAALAAMAFGTGSAGAATISPQGPFTPTASSVGLAFQGGGPAQSLRCASSTAPGTVNAPNEGKPPVSGGTPTFSNCTLPAPLGPTATVTAKEAASYEIAALPGGVKTTLGNINLHIAFPKTGCSVDALGLMVAEAPGVYPVVVSQLAFASSQTSAPSTLKVTHVGTGSYCLAFYVGQRIAFSATYKLDHSLLVSN